MRRFLVILLLLCILLSGCSTVEREISCQEIVAAYEAAGYSVFHKDPSGIDGYDCYICIEDKDRGEQIYFHRFPTAIEAQSYADTREYNILLWLFSVIYGEPSWMQTLTYGCYEIEYVGNSIYDPFAELIR